MASRLRIRLLLSLLALALVACAPAASTPSGSIPASASPPSSAPSVAPHTIYPLSLTDDAGRQVTIPAAPTRIVSLAPSNTEIVCALAACDELAGVTDFDDYPAQVKDVTHVVVGAVVDVEKVVAAQPQLILAAGNELTPTAVIDQLTRLGYAVVSLYPHDLDGVYQDVSLVGAAIDAQGHAGVLVASMKARADAVSTAVETASARAFMLATRSASSRGASTPPAATRSWRLSSPSPEATRSPATPPPRPSSWRT